MFGFECFLRNHTEQLLINSLNEQLQYHYNQRMFAWEMLEQEEEQIPGTAYRYNDNKVAVDHLMTKPYGLFYLIDDATKGRMNYEYITGELHEVLKSMDFDLLNDFGAGRYNHQKEKYARATCEQT